MRAGFMRRMRRDGPETGLSGLAGLPLARLRPLVAPHLPALALTALLAVAGSLVALAPAALIRRVVDVNLLGGEPRGLVVVVVVLVVASALEWLLGWRRGVTGERTAFRLTHELRSSLVRAALSRPPWRTVQAGPGDVLATVTADAELLAETLTSGLVNLLADLTQTLVILLAVATLTPALGAAILPVVPLTFLALAVTGRRVRDTARHERESAAGVVAGVEEGVASVRVAQSLRREKDAVERVAGAGRTALEASVASASAFASIQPILNTVGAVATVSVLLAGAATSASTGALMAALAWLRALTGPLRELAVASTALRQSGASLERILALLDAPPDLAEPAVPAAPPSTGPLEGRDLELSFEGRPVLRSTSLSVAAGTTLHVTGPSGCGKTSLAWILARLRDPDHGRVTVGGVDLRALRRQDLRRAVVLSPQEPVLPAGALLDVVTMGLPGAGRPEAEAAAAALGLTGLLDELPEGWDTAVGEGGCALSGGQRRMVALIRAALTSAPAVVLDEPLAGIDPSRAARIRKALPTAFGGRALVVVTHDLDALTEGDDVLELTSPQAEG